MDSFFEILAGSRTSMMKVGCDEMRRGRGGFFPAALLMIYLIHWIG